METLEFKTTIKCSGCVEKVTPYLNDAVGKENWQVDLNKPVKILSVTTNDENAESKVVKALAEAGYKAEKLS